MPLPDGLTSSKREEEEGDWLHECFSAHLIADTNVLRDVIVKLLAFTFAMIVVPIGSYFATVNTIFRGA